MSLSPRQVPMHNVGSQNGEPFVKDPLIFAISDLPWPFENNSDKTRGKGDGGIQKKVALSARR